MVVVTVKYLLTPEVEIFYILILGAIQNSQQQIPASGLCAGTYTVTATDANGCTKTTSVTLTEPQVLTVDITSNTNLICSSDCNATASSIGAGGTPPYAYNWSGGQVGSDPIDLCFGMNIVTLTDARNCSVSDTVFISATDTVITESLGNPVICDGDSIHLNWINNRIFNHHIRMVLSRWSYFIYQ